VNPSDIKFANIFISKLYGKTSHIVTYSRKEYKVNSDGLIMKLGHFWPRHIEYYCNQNMLGVLRLILMDEYYYEIDMEDAHYQERKKERNPLHEGPLKGIGSSVGMQPYMGGWVSHLGGTSS